LTITAGESGISRRRKFVDPIVAGVVAILALLVGIVHVPQHTTVSPIDEYVYIDYLAKVPHQIIVRQGEKTGDYAREYLTCHGVRAIGQYPALMCQTDGASDVARLPNAGYTTADLYTPFYFAATWLLAYPMKFFGVTDLTEAGRFAGAAWLAAAAVLLYLALRRLKVGEVVSASTSVVMVGSLAAYWSNTYVSTDATALLSGALALYLGIRLLEGGRHAAWLLTAAAVIMTWFKLQNLIAFVAVAFFLIIYRLFNPHSERPRTLLGRLGSLASDRRVRWAATAVVAGFLAEALWVVARAKLALGPSPDQGVGAPLTLTALLSETFKFFPQAVTGALDPSALGTWAVIAATVSAWLVVGGVIGAGVAHKPSSVTAALAYSSFITALLAGPFLAVATRLTASYYFVLPARYGASLIPIFLTCFALLARRSKVGTWFVLGAGIVTYAASLAVAG
jgi:hypothetical protein